MTAPRHVPVMEHRVVELLSPVLGRSAPSARPPVLVDATLGLGGHSEAFLRALPDLHLIGIDRDPEALRLAGERLAPYGDRVNLAQAVYDEIGEVVSDLGRGAGTAGVQGVLFDLGVSSMQLDVRERGFAYAEDAPLDMRMGEGDLTAAEVLNTYSHGALARVLSEYGEERFAGRIASRVVRAREQEPFTTSARLVEVIREAIPAPARRGGGHPAKRTFQALRIEVNDELGALRRALPAAADVLGTGGRLLVMSYQSLEDRIVKRFLTRQTTSTAPPDLPVVPEEAQPLLRLVTRGAEQASAQEVEDNPRAASVRVRAAQRVRSGSVSAREGTGAR